MNTKRQRPSAEQWAKLDSALEQLRERTPPGLTPPLSREITQRAAALRAALESGWRIRDLVAFFRESAGIDVSPSTIQAALRQALSESGSETRRSRAKRPHKQSTAGHRTGSGPNAGAVQPSRSAAPSPGQPTATSAAPRAGPPAKTADLFTEETADAPHARIVTPFGATLTPGAAKRGQR